MDTQAIEIIETEVVLEEAMSLNHARLTTRLTSLLFNAYESQFNILTELEFELSTGRYKPDVAILPQITYNWERDIIRYPKPPITAIEIISPTQTMDGLIEKIRIGYLANGVLSAWLVLPAVRSIILYLPSLPAQLVSEGTLRDPATGVELELSAVFR
ncbi:MAG: Uma2 family endonuclease [Cytophagaceae bacterium]|nr:MAG: Uma2 family endonuclease [Cytophagaceae bacterium]